MLSSVSGFLAAAGVAEVVVDVDVDVGVAAAFLLFAEVVLAVGEAGVVLETDFRRRKALKMPRFCGVAVTFVTVDVPSGSPRAGVVPLRRSVG